MALPDEAITRVEKYLDNLAGGSATLPEKPITRIEQYLAYLVENGGGGGSVTPEEIAEAVAEYLDEHGVTVTEEDPTVPSWAKASTKPTYTAQEVGALPANTTIPSTAADVGATAANQGVANAGKFLCVGNDGIVVPVALPVYSGGVT